MRRMNGRRPTPNFALIGLLIAIVLLCYKCWTLFSQNDDLRREIEKLQTEIKISAIKQESYERKTKLLQGTIHDLNDKQQKLKLKIDEEDQQLQDTHRQNKNKENEIKDLKSKLLNSEEHLNGLMKKIEEKDNKIEELKSDLQRILTLKNDAEEILSEKDSLINSLKRELELLKKDIKLKLKENIYTYPSVVPGPFNIPNLQNQGSYLSRGSLGYLPKDVVHTKMIGLQGMISHPGFEILPRQPSNALRAQPNYNIGELENLDAAVDDEGKAVDDPSDDQDEEGKEIKQDLGNRFLDNYDNYKEKAENLHFAKIDEDSEDTKNDPKGIGGFRSLGEPKQKNIKAAEGNSVDLRVADDIDPRGNERIFDTSFDSKVRNLKKYL